VVYAAQFFTTGKLSAMGPFTRPRACSMLCGVGFMSWKTGSSILSKDGMGCGAKRDSGIAQRSISRSNTDSEPKKKTTISTKPSTRPNQVCSHAMERRKFWNTEDDLLGLAGQSSARCTSQAAPAMSAPPPASTSHTRTTLRAAKAHRNATRKTMKPSDVAQRFRVVELHAGGEQQADGQCDETPGEGVAAEHARGDAKGDAHGVCAA
jgi:hypothetical protein